MKTYWDYFKYVCNHKKNVFIEAMKLGLFFHAFTHDMTKFCPSEFIPYAKYFYKSSKTEAEGKRQKAEFDRAWLIHQNRNPHHWDHWVDAQGIAFEMPEYHVKCIIADWRGMSRKFGDNTYEWYMKNKPVMILHPATIVKIERILTP